MKTLKFLAAALAAASMAACSSDPQDLVYNFQLPSCYNVVFDQGGNIVTSYKDVIYTTQYNVTNLTADLYVQGLKVNGTPYTTLTMKNIPYTTDKYGSVSFNKMLLQASSGSGTLTFDEFSFKVTSRVISGVYPPLLGGDSDMPIDFGFPLMRVSYMIGGNTYYSLPASVINTGETTVNSQMGEYKQPESERAIYYLVFDLEKMTVDMTIQGAKFAEMMPALNMRFKNMPFTFTPDGCYAITDASCPEPVVVGSNTAESPNPNYPITNLNCKTDGANNMTLTFTCTVHQKRGETEFVMPYDVTVNCKGVW